ncbi:MAG: hypothetical protein ACF8OB_01905, partial [Phycisphaeraceae bacterium JB051]
MADARLKVWFGLHLLILGVIFTPLQVAAKIFLDVNFENQQLDQEMLGMVVASPGAYFTGQEPVGQIDETINNDVLVQWYSGRLKIVNSSLIGHGKAMQFSGDYVDPKHRAARLRLWPNQTITPNMSRYVTLTYTFANNAQQNSANVYGGSLLNSDG